MTRIVTEFFFIIFIFRFGILISFTEGYGPFFHNCTHDASDNTNLQSNLKNLLSTLQSDANDSGFANRSINAGTSDQLTGLIMCYIDTNQGNCRDCLNVSTTNATTICPNSITATFTYESCFLRYSHESFLASLDLNNFPIFLYNGEIVLNSSTFSKTVSDLLNELRPEAKKEPLLYAYRNKTDPGINQTVYGLVQCTRDLDKRPDLCDLCLNSSISNLTSYLMENPYKGARYWSTNCYVRFELYPLPLLTFKPLHPTGWNKLVVPMVFISTVVGAILFIFVAGVWFWRMLRRKQISTSSPENKDLERVACGECRMFLLSELTSATFNFSEKNRLGQGGFGSVYKVRSNCILFSTWFEKSESESESGF